MLCRHAVSRHLARSNLLQAVPHRELLPHLREAKHRNSEVVGLDDPVATTVSEEQFGVGVTEDLFLRNPRLEQDIWQLKTVDFRITFRVGLQGNDKANLCSVNHGRDLNNFIHELLRGRICYPEGYVNYAFKRIQKLLVLLGQRFSDELRVKLRLGASGWVERQQLLSALSAVSKSIDAVPKQDSVATDSMRPLVQKLLCVVHPVLPEVKESHEDQMHNLCL